MVEKEVLEDIARISRFKEEDRERKVKLKGTPSGVLVVYRYVDKSVKPHNYLIGFHLETHVSFYCEQFTTENLHAASEIKKAQERNTPVTVYGKMSILERKIIVDRVELSESKFAGDY